MNQKTELTPKEVNRVPSYAWVVLCAVYLASLSAPLNLFKVPPMMTRLQDLFQMSSFSAGSLMSIFSVMGFVLAIPAGFIVMRFGIKPTILCAVGALTIGGVIGALSTTLGLLFLGRFIEGVGMGLVMVAAPAAISVWFPADKRAFPMGLWASCVGVGNIAMFILAPVLAAKYDWRTVWWAGSVVAAASFVVFALLFRMPKPGEMAEPAPPAAGTEPVSVAKIGIGKAMANRDLLLLSVEFMCFNLVIMALNSFYPAFLEKVLKYSNSEAGVLTSLMMAIAIFAGPAGSHLSDRLRSRKALIVGPFLVLTVLYAFPFTITGWMIPAYMLAVGIVMGPIAPVTLAAVPEIMPSPAMIGIGMGVAAVGQNLGMYIGPVLFGYLLDTTSWATAGYVMIPICLVGVITGWLARVR